MLIVGGTAALTAIAVYLAWIAIRSLRATWRARHANAEAVAARESETSRQAEAHAEFHAAPGE